MGRNLLLTIVLVLLVPAVAWAQGRVGARAAEVQVKPSLAMTFGGETSFVDWEDAAGRAKLAFGLNGVLLGDVFGLEGDFGRTPGYFDRGDPPPDKQLVVQSSVSTLTGGLVIAAPRRLTEYTLRPYFVVGAGVVRVRIKTSLDVLPVVGDLPVLDVGGGVTAFFNDRIGVAWDFRHFGSIGDTAAVRGASIGPEQLSFWRGSMALAIRY